MCQDMYKPSQASLWSIRHQENYTQFIVCSTQKCSNFTDTPLLHAGIGLYILLVFTTEIRGVLSAVGILAMALDRKQMASYPCPSYNF